jgi:hypothetical protein
MTVLQREKEVQKLVDHFDSILMDHISDEFARKYTSRDCAMVAINLTLDALEVKIRPKILGIQVQLNKDYFNELKQALKNL